MFYVSRTYQNLHQTPNTKLTWKTHFLPIEPIKLNKKANAPIKKLKNWNAPNKLRRNEEETLETSKRA